MVLSDLDNLSDWAKKYTDPAYCLVCNKPSLDDSGRLQRVRKNTAWFCSNCNPDGWLELHIHGSQIPLLLTIIDQYFMNDEKYEQYQEIDDIVTMLKSIKQAQDERNQPKPKLDDPKASNDLDDLPF